MSAVKFVNPLGEETSVVERTDICCWNCTHPFESKPLSLPVYYNTRTFTYQSIGVFCSYECMKRYNMDRTRSSSQVYKISFYITTLHKKLEGVVKTGIKTAPGLDQLKRFGGSLTIDEYRERSTVSHAKTPQRTEESEPQKPATSDSGMSSKPSSKRKGEIAVEKIRKAPKIPTESLRLKRHKNVSTSGQSMIALMGITFQASDESQGEPSCP